MKKILLIVSAFLLFQTAAFAQGSIEGTVLSEMAQPLPNLTVTLVDADGTTDATKTDEDGAFSFADLNAGNFKLTVTVPTEYQPFSQNNVVVNDGDATTVQFVLKRKLAPMPPVPQQTPEPVRPTTSAPVSAGPANFKIEDDGYSGTKLAILAQFFWDRDVDPSRDIPEFRVLHARYMRDRFADIPPREMVHKPSQGPWNSGNWRFEPAGDGYYYIFSVDLPKVGLVGGDSDQNDIHLTAPDGREEAIWRLEPLGNNKFHIVCKTSGWVIVAGDNADGHVYHQAARGRRNAVWTITLLSGNENIPKEYKVN